MTPPDGGPSRILTDHPFADGDPLISTEHRTLAAGEVRMATADLAGRLGSARLEAGRPGGVWLAGGVSVPTSPRQPAAGLAHVIESTRPAMIIDGSGIREPGGVPAEHEADTAFVTWTSGTTGEPKPILHTHSGYLELLDRVLAPLRGRPSDPRRPPTPNLVPVSLSLNAGIYNALFGLRAGAQLVLMDRFSTGGFASLVGRFG